MSEVVVSSESPAVEDALVPAKGAEVAPQEEAKQEEATESEAPKDSAEGEQEKTEKPRKNRLQERFDELTRAREEARKEAEYWRKLVLDKQEAQPVTQTSDAEPQLEQFSTELEYAKAHAKWVARQEAYALIQQREEAIQRAAQQREAETQVQSYQARIAEARTRYSDYEEVMVTAPDIPLPPHISQALLESEFGPDVAYRLAKDPARVQRIVSLTPTAALREIGKVEAEIEAGRKSKAAPPRVSNAPEPISPVDAKTSTPSRDAEPGPDRPYGEWLAWRNKQRR